MNKSKADILDLAGLGFDDEGNAVTLRARWHFCSNGNKRAAESVCLDLSG